MSDSTAMVYNIQRFCLHDGPGIRTVVFFKGCPLQCHWCCNPESQSFQPQIMYNRILCRGCHACIAACDHDAIRVVETGIALDRQSCKACGKCAEACCFMALRLSGKRMSIDEIMKRVLQDRCYYETSGGGVTLSGGEPTMQGEFLLALIKGLREQGVHVVLETCGACQPERFVSIAGICDEVLFDIKHVDPRKHLEYTGKDNAWIIENLRRAAEVTSMTVRIPLIPGVNMEEPFYKALVPVLSGLRIRKVELLPYHRLGRGKYAQLGLAYPCEKTPLATRNENSTTKEYIAQLLDVPVVLGD